MNCMTDDGKPSEPQAPLWSQVVQRNPDPNFMKSVPSAQRVLAKPSAEPKKKRRKTKKKSTNDTDEISHKIPTEPVTPKPKPKTTFNLSDILESVPLDGAKAKEKKVHISPIQPKILHSSAVSSTSFTDTKKNVLDSTAPTKVRGKERLTPKQKKPSKLKTGILSDRAEKARPISPSLRSSHEEPDSSCSDCSSTADGIDNGELLTNIDPNVKPDDEVQTEDEAAKEAEFDSVKSLSVAEEEDEGLQEGLQDGDWSIPEDPHSRPSLETSGHGTQSSQPYWSRETDDESSVCSTPVSIDLNCHIDAKPFYPSSYLRALIDRIDVAQFVDVTPFIPAEQRAPETMVRAQPETESKEKPLKKAVKTVVPPKKVPRTPSYSPHTVTVEIEELVKDIMKLLQHYQDRSYKQDPTSYLRRIVSGFNDVKNNLKADKVKMVILANDIENVPMLMGEIDEVKTRCAEREIPVVVALSRKGLANCCKRRSITSVIGVLEHDVARDQVHKLMKLIGFAKTHET